MRYAANREGRMGITVLVMILTSLAGCSLTPETVDRSASLENLFEAVNQGDGAAFQHGIERLIVGKERDHSILLAFLRKLESDRPAFVHVTGDATLTFALAHVIVRCPDESAALARYVLDATAGERSSYLRRELLRKLPSFLQYHRGRYRAVARLVEGELLSALEPGSVDIYSALQGLDEMGIDPPLESLVKLLETRGNYNLHGMVIRRIASRKDRPAVNALLAFIESNRDSRLWTVERARQAIAGMDSVEGEDAGRGPSVDRPGHGGPGSSTETSGTRSLMESVVRRDGPALSAELEGLLRGGERGYGALYEFFHRADVDHEKILSLTHDPQLVLGQLRLAVLHPEEVARFSEYLMTATADRTESFLRREIFNFLPVFLRHHRGRFSWLKARLEREILYQLETGGDYLYKVFLAMSDLGFEPPVTSFFAILDDPARRPSHAMILEHLAGRGEDGLGVLVRYVERAGDSRWPEIGQALRLIYELDDSGGKDIFRPFLEHREPHIRDRAVMVERQANRQTGKP